VIGLVRRNNGTAIFVQIGTAIRSVGIEQRFGEQNALAVKSVEGRNVTIMDTTSNISKTYTLSEE
jgi:hypothetical protein